METFGWILYSWSCKTFFEQSLICLVLVLIFFAHYVSEIPWILNGAEWNFFSDDYDDDNGVDNDNNNDHNNNDHKDNHKDNQKDNHKDSHKDVHTELEFPKNVISLWRQHYEYKVF